MIMETAAPAARTSMKESCQVKHALGRTCLMRRLIQVEAPDPTQPNKCMMAFTKEPLEQACLAEAQWHFTQAAQTPALQLPSTQQLDSLHIGSPAFYQILEGTYPYHKLKDPYMVKLLKQLKQPSGMLEVLPQTQEEYKSRCPYQECILVITLRQ